MKLNLEFKKTFKFKVNGHQYRVKFIKQNSDTELENDYGFCDFAKRLILIREDIPDSLKLSTFIHELMHILEDLYSVKISHKDLNLVSDMIAAVLAENFQIKEPKDDNSSKI